MTMRKQHDSNKIQKENVGSINGYSNIRRENALIHGTVLLYVILADM